MKRLGISIIEEELKKRMEEDGADGYVEVEKDEELTVVDRRISLVSFLPHLCNPQMCIKWSLFTFGE